MAEIHPFAALGFVAWVALGFGLLVLGKLWLDRDPGPSAYELATLPPGFRPKPSGRGFLLGTFLYVAIPGYVIASLIWLFGSN
ncbi:MAG: hypothetical protein ABI635_07805 [Actinomycetota bacterium]